MDKSWTRYFSLLFSVLHVGSSCWSQKVQPDGACLQNCLWVIILTCVCLPCVAWWPVCGSSPGFGPRRVGWGSQGKSVWFQAGESGSWSTALSECSVEGCWSAGSSAGCATRRIHTNIQLKQTNKTPTHSVFHLFKGQKPEMVSDLLRLKIVSQCFSVMFLISCTSSSTRCLQRLFRKWAWSFSSSLYDVRHTWKLLGSDHHCKEIRQTGIRMMPQGYTNLWKMDILTFTDRLYLRSLLLPKYKRILRPGHQRLNSISQFNSLQVLTTTRWGPHIPANKKHQLTSGLPTKSEIC